MSILNVAFRAGIEFEKSDLGTYCLLPFAEEIIAIVRAHPADDGELEEQFKEMWRNPEIPHELLAICMHHLKIPGIRAFIEEAREKALQNNEWRAEGPTRMVLAAYHEPWEDYDLFYG